MSFFQFLYVVFHWIQQVDLLKWIVTVAIPTGGHFIYKWLRDRNKRLEAEKRRKEKFERFMEGLPMSVKGLLETFNIYKLHTVELDPDYEAVSLAIGLGVISFVSRSQRAINYRLRDDIWAYFYKDIKLQRNRVSYPSDKGTTKKNEII